VGIDFGTSGTKLAIRDLTDSRRGPILVDFGTDTPGLVRFAIPSLVSVEGGFICVAESAARAGANGSRQVWSPKRLLLHGDLELDTAYPALISSSFLDEGWRSPPTPAEFFAALFLAEVIGRANQIVNDLADGADFKVFYNLDVPMAALDQSKGERRFQRALDAALLLSGKGPKRIPVENAVDRWCEALLHLRRHPPAEEDRVAFLVPEAQAVMHGMGTALRLENGARYVVFDVGAGTTDIGVFCYNRLPNKTVVGYFAADSAPWGCDSIDELIRTEPARNPRSPGELSREDAAAIRLATVNGHIPGKGNGPADPALYSAEVDAAAAKVAREVFDHYSKAVFPEAYSKEKNTEVWAVLNTLVVGGGSLLPVVRTGLWKSPRPEHFRVASVSLSERERCEVIGAGNDPPAGDELIFLFPAIGLSHLGPEMDDLIPPSRLEPLGPPPKQPTGRYAFDADELYSK